MHFSSDTYVLYDLGYMAYPQKYFLLDGRLISTVVCFIAGILHIPINAYIIGMDFIGIIFVGTAIFTISKVFEKLINPKSPILKTVLKSTGTGWHICSQRLACSPCSVQETLHR